MREKQKNRCNRRCHDRLAAGVSRRRMQVIKVTESCLRTGNFTTARAWPQNQAGQLLLARMLQNVTDN